MNTLIKIKRLLIANQVKFTEKAVIEMARDRITPLLVVEAILNAQAISKRIASHNPKTGQREYLYIISGQTLTGLIIYTKGKFLKKEKQELYYILISSKRDVNF